MPVSPKHKANPKTADFAELHEAGQDFGDFYPTGHIFAAFPGAAEAQAARGRLLQEGVAEAECRYFDDQTVLEGTRRGLDEATLVSSIGSTMKMVGLHHDLAAKGCHFLLVTSPHDADDARIMAVLNRGPVSLAQKYKRFTIETLAQNDPLAGRQK